jgi:energy-coupling factor transporter transmembrane protein EcfT
MVIFVLVIFFCLFLTLALAFFAGSIEKPLFDFRNINLGNMIPVLIIGGLVSCMIISICFLLLSKSFSEKLKELWDKNNSKSQK